MNLKRFFNPTTNPALYSALLGVAYAIWQGIQAAQASGHTVSWTQIEHIAAGAVWAAVSVWVRGKVTPVKDPKDGNGQPLNTHAVIHVTGDPTKQPAIITPSGPISAADLEELKTDWQRVFGVQVPTSTTTGGAS